MRFKGKLNKINIKNKGFGFITITEEVRETLTSEELISREHKDIYYHNLNFLDPYERRAVDMASRGDLVSFEIKQSLEGRPQAVSLQLEFS